MRRKIIALVVCLFLCAAYSYAGNYATEEISSAYDDPETYSVETIETEDSGSIYDADNDTAVLACIFDAILTMFYEVDECDEDDPYCALEAIFNMILGIIEC